MRQLAQRLKDGRVQVVQAPPPALDAWKVLVRTQASLVSAGTERAKVEVARESLIGKARRRPDQVRQVLEKVRTDGLRPTVDAVRTRLEALSPLGYCATGVVEQVGRKVRDLHPGDRVACGGEGAAHAEVLAVPGNLCVTVPSGVDPVAACFSTLGAIALHGFRQADLRLGERVAVVGMGLVGQLTARIARAAGCEVLGVDLDEWPLEIARAAGGVDTARRRADVGQELLDAWDAVIVTAAAPGTNDPMTLATALARDRGVLVVVGDVRLDLDRRRLYEKELDVRLARSYGPGRYDRDYEERGLDYPLEYVRWSERRNMAAFLDLIDGGRLAVDDLVTHRIPIVDGPRAFDVLTDVEQRSLAIVLEYEDAADQTTAGPRVTSEVRPFVPGAAIGFIGAGSFAQRHLMPLAARHGLVLDRVASATGLSAASAVERFSFKRGAASAEELLDDAGLNGIVVATRHGEHAALARAALRAGKAVFVEKPLCLDEQELAALSAELDRRDAPPLMVGFNRRFAPLTVALADHMRVADGPSTVLVRVNAGPLPADHWLNDPVEGGGRLLGEGCHFLDLICHLVGAPAVAVMAQTRFEPNRTLQTTESFTVSMRFDDGSLGTLVYGTAGAPAAGKELVEMHRGPRSGRIDDFLTLELAGGGRSRKRKDRSRDKGHSAELAAFAAVVRGEAPAPDVGSYLASTALTLAALRSLELGAEQELVLPTSSVEEA